MRSRVIAPLFALAVFGLLSPAHASELRFSITAKGEVIGTGNTLGLSKQSAANGPGTSDSIGTFLTPDMQLVDLFPANPGNEWFQGTTNDWTQNGSSAVLELPMSSSGIEVVYAELVWGGSYLYGSENVTADLNTPVTLAANGMSIDVVPAPQTAVTLAEIATQGFAVNYYMRSAEVTDFVAAQLSGTYMVSGVPATQDTTINSLNAAGWTLVVVVRRPDAPTRNLTVFVGGQFVEEDDVEDYPVSGFCTPPEGMVEGGVIISALEGDANLTGDIFQIAATANGPFATLSGPNNPSNNFFCSQINGIDGTLDTLGSAGDRNQDAFAGLNIAGGRQGWDVTKVPLSSAQNQIGPGQTSAVLRAITTGDSFMPVLAAFEIDVSSPDFEANSGIMASPGTIGVGQQSTLTIDIVNDGEVTANGLSFRAPLGAGLELVSFAIDGTPGDINQQPVSTAELSSGVALGSVPTSAGLEVTMVVEATAAPAMQSWPISASWTYEYVSCVGEQPLVEQSFAFVSLGFSGSGDGDGDGDGGGDGDGAGDGDGGNTAGDGGSGTDGGSMGTDTGDTFGTDPRGDGDDGCNCRSGGPATPLGTLGLFGLLGLLGARRKREVSE